MKFVVIFKGVFARVEIGAGFAMMVILPQSIQISSLQVFFGISSSTFFICNRIWSMKMWSLRWEADLFVEIIWEVIAAVELTAPTSTAKGGNGNSDYICFQSNEKTNNLSHFNRCRDFDRMQDCRRGLMCPFLHVSVQTRSVPGSSSMSVVKSQGSLFLSVCCWARFLYFCFLFLGALIFILFFFHLVLYWFALWSCRFWCFEWSMDDGRRRYIWYWNHF